MAFVLKINQDFVKNRSNNGEEDEKKREGAEEGEREEKIERRTRRKIIRAGKRRSRTKAQGPSNASGQARSWDRPFKMLGTGPSK